MFPFLLQSGSNYSGGRTFGCGYCASDEGNDK